MHTKTIPSKFIKLFTRYSYSHIALSFTKNCNTIYSFGRKKYNSIFNSGFVEEHKTGKFFKKFTCFMFFNKTRIKNGIIFFSSKTINSITIFSKR